MVGNVFEWTEDCVHDDYRGAPTDGSAWRAGGDCSNRIVRGGSRDFSTAYIRSANRVGFSFDLRVDIIGFRVGRILGSAAGH